MKKKILKNAAKISLLITEINTDFRGNLFKEIGKQLDSQTQYYTGKLFHQIADEYGINKKVSK